MQSPLPPVPGNNQRVPVLKVGLVVNYDAANNTEDFEECSDSRKSDCSLT